MTGPLTLSLNCFWAIYFKIIGKGSHLLWFRRITIIFQCIFLGSNTQLQWHNTIRLLLQVWMPTTVKSVLHKTIIWRITVKFILYFPSIRIKNGCVSVMANNVPSTRYSGMYIFKSNFSDLSQRLRIPQVTNIIHSNDPRCQIMKISSLL